MRSSFETQSWRNRDERLCCVNLLIWSRTCLTRKSRRKMMNLCLGSDILKPFMVDSGDYDSSKFQQSHQPPNSKCCWKVFIFSHLFGMISCLLNIRDYYLRFSGKFLVLSSSPLSPLKPPYPRFSQESSVGFLVLNWVSLILRTFLKRLWINFKCTIVSFLPLRKVLVIFVGFIFTYDWLK